MNTNFENLLVEQDGAVVTVSVNRPKALNALNAATMGELRAVFAEIADDDSVRAVILTGAGDKAFVAGADIKELKEAGPMSAKKLARDGQKLFTSIERLGKPVIAAVNGYALGGGLELAAACTFRTASTKAKLGLPEVSLGIIPGYGGTQRLPRLVGLGRAAEMILTGDPIGAEQAMAMGLVNHVFEPDELMSSTRTIVDSILKRGPLAVKFALEAVFMSPDVPLDDGLNLESNMFGLLSTTEDMREGMTAFVERRAAEFKGN